MDLFKVALVTVAILSMLLMADTADDNSVCRGKDTYYTCWTKGWFGWGVGKKKKRCLRKGKKRCCDGYTGTPPDCTRKRHLELIGEGKTEIAYKLVNGYEKIWDDSFSWYYSDISIWRPIDHQTGFYPLGDVATKRHSKPPGYATTVRALVPGALAEPEGFTEVWNDDGSGAARNVVLFKLNPKPGYTCLGYVAAAHDYNYNLQPDISKYRCVLSSLVITGSYLEIWRSKGLEFSERAALWTNSKSSTVKGISINTFTAHLGYEKPPNPPYILNSEYAVLSTLAPEYLGHQRAIKIYELPGKENSNEIWQSPIPPQIAIYRAKLMLEYSIRNDYSLGDVAQTDFENVKPAPLNYIFAAIAIKNDALKKPVDFCQIWTDEGSSIFNDVAIWQPICSPGYVSLGHVSVGSHTEKPSSDAVRCVKEDYVVIGEWERVWDDENIQTVFSKNDVTLWRAVSRDESGQGVLAISAVARHGQMDDGNPAYVLNSRSIDYISGPPVKEYILEDVEYLHDTLTIVSKGTKEVQRTVATNRNYDTEEKFEKALVFTYTVTNSWSESNGLEQGVTLSVTAGVPDVASATLEVSATISTEYTTGEEVSMTSEHSIKAITTVKPRTKREAKITATTYVAEVAYRGQLKRVFTDGSTSDPVQYTGIYRGVQYNNFEVIWSKAIPL